MRGKQSKGWLAVLLTIAMAPAPALAQTCRDDIPASAPDSRFFPNTPTGTVFWSSSPTAYYANGAWGVYFYYGYVNINYKCNAYYVRLVRGGQ